MGKLDKIRDGETPKLNVKIREMMKHAWDRYREYAWGDNEQRPVAKRGNNDFMFGQMFDK